MFDQTRKNLLLITLLALFVVGWTQSSCKNVVADPDGKAQSKPRSESGYPLAPRMLSQSSLKALEGEDFRIGDYKGKVVLINLWATWCAPCIQEMPHFNKLQEKYGEDGFVMVGLNSDEETEAQVSIFVKNQNLNYKIGWATQEVVNEFFKISKLRGIPQSLLLNRDGEMTGMYRGGGPTVIEKMVDSVDKMMAE